MYIILKYKIYNEVVINMMTKLLKGYFIKNRNKFFIIVFAIAVCTMIIFANKVSKNSQSNYVVKETVKQMADYQAKFKNVSKRDLDIIKNSEDIKNTIVSKYYGDIKTEQNFYKLESYNSDSFKELKNTLIYGHYPRGKNEVIIDLSFFELLKSQGKINMPDDNKFKEIYVDFRYIKEYQNNKEEEVLLDETQNFKIVGVYDFSQMMKRYKDDGFSVYVHSNFDYPSVAITYNGYINLKNGFKGYTSKTNKLQGELTSTKSQLTINEDRQMALSDNSSSLTTLDKFDKGIIIASLVIIFNVFSIMSREIIREIGLLRIVGMSKKQSFILLFIKNLITLITGLTIGFLLGCILSVFMIRYMNFDSSMLIDPRKAPILITTKSITNTIKTITYMFIVSTIVPVLSIIMSYPIDMISGKLKFDLRIENKVLSKLKIYKKMKNKVTSIVYKYSDNIKHNNRNMKMYNSKYIKMKLAMKNSKRNLVYIITTGILVAMSGLYIVSIFIDNQSSLVDNNPLLLKLGDYDIDLNYIGSDSILGRGITEKEINELNNIDGIESIYSVKRRVAFSRLNTKDLSKAMKTTMFLNGKDKEIDYGIDLLSINEDASKNLLNDYKGLIEKGQMFAPNRDIPEVVIFNKIEDWSSGSRNLVDANKKYKLGDIIDVKISMQENGKLVYKTVKVKVVGFLSDKWEGVNEGLSNYPDIVMDSSDFKKITGENTYDEIKIKVNPDKLETVKESIENRVKDNKSIKYDDRSSIEKEITQYRWINTVRELFNSMLFAFTASINIFFSVITSIEVRRKEFGIMRSIGLSLKDLKGILIREGLIYGIFSSILGLIFIFNYGVKLSSMLKRMSEHKHIEYSGSWYILPMYPTLIFIIVTILICLLAVALTFRRLSKNIVDQIDDI